MRRLFLTALIVPLIFGLLTIFTRNKTIQSLRNACCRDASSQPCECPSSSPSWGDGQLHRWFDEDGIPVSYSRWRDLDGVFPPEPKMRSTLYRFGARVACWPSEGGIWIKHAVPIEMSFLNVSKTSDTKPSEDPYDEDEFCTKLRLIGAEYWELPLQNLTNLSCAPLEKCVAPKIQGHLGMAWLPGAAKGLGGAYMVNLTEAMIRKKLGPGLGGFYQANSMRQRLSIALEKMDGFWCPEESAACGKLWCDQYPEHCHESYLLTRDDDMWDCQRVEGDFY